MDTLSELRAGRLTGLQRLDLSCGLTEFPREIFDLADTLEVLNLSGNLLSALPDDLPRLHRLRVVFGSDNRFTELPAVLGQCAALEMVGFKANQIVDVPGAALPPLLRWLILTDNQVETLPPDIGRCHQLQKLMLAGNRLSALPDTLADCRQLELLRLSANRFEALPDWLLTLPRLTWLACAGNPMSREPQPADISAVTWRDLTVGALLGEGASGLIYQATWRRPDGAMPVAVKLFKGEVTSDGWPQNEMAASLAVGAHPNLIPVAGPLAGHPQGTAGLVMHFIPPNFTTLAGPPSLASCTRDVYAPGTSFSALVLLRIARGVAAAGAHLHAHGLLHGDLYAHNLQCDADGNCLLGDMGAASFLPDDAVQSLALQRLEVRAFGCLLEELLQHADDSLPATSLGALSALRDDCLHALVARRPLYAAIVQRLEQVARMSAPAVLRDVVWHSLGEGHAALAQTADGARRYQPAYAPFAALARYDDANFDALAGLMAAGEEVAFFTVGDIAPTAHFEVLMRKDIQQMVGPATPLQAPAVVRAVPLGPEDVPAMRALVEATKPGPFRERSHELGHFIGIHVEGRLVAMAGERLHLDGFREISGVCTSPECRGQGHARELVQQLAAAITARGQTPFLHVFTDNHGAIALYRQLGFTPSQAFRVTVLRRL